MTCMGGHVCQSPCIGKPVAPTVAADQSEHCSCLLPPALSITSRTASPSLLIYTSRSEEWDKNHNCPSPRKTNQVFATPRLALALAEAAKSPAGPVTRATRPQGPILVEPGPGAVEMR